VAGVKLKPTVREVGTFKGIIRIVDSESVPPLFDIRQVRFTFALFCCCRFVEGMWLSCDEAVSHAVDFRSYCKSS
jgi:hypothetical protein